MLLYLLFGQGSRALLYQVPFSWGGFIKDPHFLSSKRKDLQRKSFMSLSTRTHPEAKAWYPWLPVYHPPSDFSQFVWIGLGRPSPLLTWHTPFCWLGGQPRLKDWPPPRPHSHTHTHTRACGGSNEQGEGVCARVRGRVGKKICSDLYQAHTSLRNKSRSFIVTFPPWLLPLGLSWGSSPPHVDLSSPTLFLPVKKGVLSSLAWHRIKIILTWNCSPK